MASWRSSPTATSTLVLLSTFLVAFHSPLPAFAQEAAHSPGWVVISVSDYRVLRAKAYPSERDPEQPPVEATLTRVDYDLQITSDLAAGRATLTVDVLKDGWVRVPIPSGLLVRQARLDGKLLALVPWASSKGGGQLYALLSHSGRAVLLLDIALPIASSAGNESVSLPATESGVTRASVQLPRQGVDVRISGGLLPISRSRARAASGLPMATGPTRSLLHGAEGQRITAAASFCGCAGLSPN